MTRHFALSVFIASGDSAGTMTAEGWGGKGLRTDHCGDGGKAGFQIGALGIHCGNQSG